MGKPHVLDWVFAEYPRARARSTMEGTEVEQLRVLPVALSAVAAGLLAVFAVIAVAVSAVTLFG